MIIGRKVKLRDKRLDDALNDYTWQADPELARLDAVPRLTVTFPQYLLAYTSELRFASSARYRFAVDTLDDKHIGNCAYYGINEAKDEAELGIMIGDRDYWDKGYGTDGHLTCLRRRGSCPIHRQSFKPVKGVINPG